jgi:hypothetical protein
MQRTNNDSIKTPAGRPTAAPAVRRATARDIPTLVAMIEAYWKFEAIANFDATRLGMQLERLMFEPKMGAAWIAHEVALQLAKNNDAAREFYLRQGYAARAGYELVGKDL